MYTELKRETIGNVELVIDYTPSQYDPREALENEMLGNVTPKAKEEIDEVVQKIESGEYSWFNVRARVMSFGLLIASNTWDNQLYTNPVDCLAGIDDLIGYTLDDAKIVLDELKSNVDKMIAG